MTEIVSFCGVILVSTGKRHQDDQSGRRKSNQQANMGNDVGRISAKDFEAAGVEDCTARFLIGGGGRWRRRLRVPFFSSL